MKEQTCQYKVSFKKYTVFKNKYKSILCGQALVESNKVYLV